MPQETIEGPQTRKLVVARGRTVQTGNGYTVEYETVSVGGKPTIVSKQIPAEGKHLFTEGEEVELPAGEAKRLFDLGFLVDPDAPQSRPLGLTAEAIAATGTDAPAGRVQELPAGGIGLVDRKVT